MIRTIRVVDIAQYNFIAYKHNTLDFAQCSPWSWLKQFANKIKSSYKIFNLEPRRCWNNDQTILFQCFPFKLYKGRLQTRHSIHLYTQTYNANVKLVTLDHQLYHVDLKLVFEQVGGRRCNCKAVSPKYSRRKWFPITSVPHILFPLIPLWGVELKNNTRRLRPVWLRAFWYKFISSTWRRW